MKVEEVVKDSVDGDWVEGVMVTGRPHREAFPLYLVICSGSYEVEDCTVSKYIADDLWKEWYGWEDDQRSGDQGRRSVSP